MINTLKMEEWISGSSDRGQEDMYGEHGFIPTLEQQT